MTPRTAYTHKPCLRCKRTLPLSNFYHFRKGKGYDSRCKPCRAALHREQVFQEIDKRCKEQGLAYQLIPSAQRPSPKVCVNPGCIKQGTLQPPENFVKASLNSDGLAVCCRYCHIRPKTKHDREIIRAARYAAKRKICIAKRTEWGRKNPSKQRGHARRSAIRRYGVTPEWYDATLKSQSGRCAICGSTKPGGGGRFHIDHDHNCCPGTKRSCGKCVRGLLCAMCNSRLSFIENPEWMKRALNYLKNGAAVQFPEADRI